MWASTRPLSSAITLRRRGGSLKKYTNRSRSMAFSRSDRRTWDREYKWQLRQEKTWHLGSIIIAWILLKQLFPPALMGQHWLMAYPGPGNNCWIRLPSQAEVLKTASKKVEGFRVWWLAEGKMHVNEAEGEEDKSSPMVEERDSTPIPFSWTRNLWWCLWSTVPTWWVLL